MSRRRTRRMYRGVWLMPKPDAIFPAHAWSLLAVGLVIGCVVVLVVAAMVAPRGVVAWLP